MAYNDIDCFIKRAEFIKFISRYKFSKNIHKSRNKYRSISTHYVCLNYRDKCIYLASHFCRHCTIDRAKLYNQYNAAQKEAKETNTKFLFSEMLYLIFKHNFNFKI